MLCCSKGQNEAKKDWCCPSRLFCITFPHHSRTVLAASRPPHAGQPSPCHIFLPICHKHTPQCSLWGPQAHFHVPSILLLKETQNCTWLLNGASKPCTGPGDNVKDYGKSIRVLECVINFQVIANKVISVLKCFPDLEGCKVELFYFPGISSIMSTHFYLLGSIFRKFSRDSGSYPLGIIKIKHWNTRKKRHFCSDSVYYYSTLHNLLKHIKQCKNKSFHLHFLISFFPCCGIHAFHFQQLSPQESQLSIIEILLLFSIY